MNSNKHTTIILILALAAIAGCAQDEEVRTWNIANVSQRDIIVAVQAAGVIEPVTTVELKSKASGEILEISAETGAVVEAGDRRLKAELEDMDGFVERFSCPFQFAFRASIFGEVAELPAATGERPSHSSDRER